MSERIKEITLPADFVDGQILYGTDVNTIITVLREAINFNKYDIDKAYLGQLNDFVFVFYDDMDEEITADDDQYAIVLRGNVGGGSTGDEDTVVLYQWDLATTAWVYVDDMVGIVEMWQGYKAFEDRMAIAEIDIEAVETSIDNIVDGTQAITYNPAVSGMTAVTVKTALDELDAEIDDIKDGTTIVAKATGDKDGNAIDTTYLKKAGGTMSGAIAMGTNKITGLANGTSAADAINKSQLDLKENLTNKKTTLTDDSDSYYPTQKAVKTAVDLKEDKANKGATNGYVPLVGGVIPAAYIPNAYDDFLVYATYALLEAETELNTAVLYIVTADETSGNNTSTYRWSGASFIKIHDQLSASEVKTLYESNADTNAYTDSEKSHLANLPADAYSQTALNDGQLDTRYYTETELDDGQLDTRYYTETETADGTIPIVKTSTHVDTPKVILATGVYMEYNATDDSIDFVIE